MSNAPSPELLGDGGCKMRWECFSDETYFDMWCVREVGSRTFGGGFHVHSGQEARGLCDLLNTRAAIAAISSTRLSDEGELRGALSYGTVSMTEHMVVIDFEDRERAEAMFAELAQLRSGETQEPTEAIKAALQEAMQRYPDARNGLAWFAAASGLAAGEITQEVRDWAAAAMLSAAPQVDYCGWVETDDDAPRGEM